MLRSAASRLLCSFRGVLRTSIIRTASVAPFGDGKFISPSNEGVTGPDPTVQGGPVKHTDYEQCTGTLYPAEAWSDGEARVVWDKMPPDLEPNPTIMKPPAKETDEEFDSRFIAYFNRPDIDGWELRKALAELHCADLVPEPKVTIAAFHAMRRLSEHSMAVRWLECIEYKCGPNKKKIWPWMMQELRPTLDELGISTPDEMGYDKPELWQEDVYDM